MKILNVDDKPENLYLLETMMRSSGYEVESASNGQEAIKKLEGGGFDIIVSDILMPQMDGFQLCREIKSRPEFRNIPFIFYTATYTDRQDQELGLSLGAARFILKPEEPDRFMAILVEVIKEYSAGKVVAAKAVPEPENEYLKLYNSRLVVKIEQKLAEVEALAQSLKEALTVKEREMAERMRLEDELRQVQKMETIGLLAGGIAHDFNNLLSAIMGELSLMESEIPLKSPLMGDLSIIKAQVNRGADLTRQLLGFAHRGKASVKPLDLNDLMLKTSKMFGRTRKDIEIRWTPSPEPLRISADRTQMEQVLLNLFVNAGQAMPEGGELCLRVEKCGLSESDAAFHAVKPGVFVRIVVSDTGIGMDAQTKERVFEPFFTTRRAGHGTGLGLALAQSIVKNHGGFITVESQPGRGATFTVHVPTTESEVAAEIKPGPAGAVLIGANRTLLVVDDEEPILQVVRRILLNVGFQVLTVRNGQQAVEMFHNHPGEISLVIMDMVMPGLSGLETFDALRKLDPKVKVLLTSGYSSEGDVSAILEHGCNGFLRKPFGAEELSEKLKELL